MRACAQCVPCVLKHVVETAHKVTDDQLIHERVVLDLVHWISDNGLDFSAPQLAQRAYRHLKWSTGWDDPFKEQKLEMNKRALALVNQLEQAILLLEDQFEAATKLAIFGNIIDLGIEGLSHSKAFETAIEEILDKPLVAGGIQDFKNRVNRAEKIMYLMDNAGEIVFDKLLINLLPPEKVICVVRGYPVINDATMADAALVGLPELTKVISNGSDAPGTILDECSSEFTKFYKESDFIISKGQGNFETLQRNYKQIAFLLTAKCNVVANEFGCNVGDAVLSIHR